MAEFKVGDTVRNTSNGTLFVVVALPRPKDRKTADLGDPRVTVKYRDNPSQVRQVDPALYVATTAEEVREADAAAKAKTKAA